jgi:cation:H+ antiporter
MFITYTLLILGIIFLIKGADYLVKGSSALAKKFGISSLVIGLTVVSFGTSAPELFVSIFAALEGNAEVTLGNIIGSNISNILLILGITAFITKLKVKRSTIWEEIPFAIVGAIMLLIIANANFLSSGTNPSIDLIHGIVLLAIFSLFLYYIFKKIKKDKPKALKEKIIEPLPYYKIIPFILLGLAGLYFGGNLTVDAAVTIAKSFGLSEYLISATIIAIGTSLPELVTSVIAAKKKEVDIAVGNIIGSNIFNIFWILGITALFSPILIPSFITIDLIIHLAATLLLFFFAYTDKYHIIKRKEGIVFLICYIAYIAFLIIRG